MGLLPENPTQYLKAATVLRELQDRGSKRGLYGNSTAWLVVWILVMGWRTFRRISAPDRVVVSERLKPGERLVIEHFDKGITLQTLAAGDPR